MHPYHGIKESFMSSAINSDLATTDNKGYFNPPIENYRSMYKYYDRIKGTQVTTENEITFDKTANANNALRLVPNRQQHKKKQSNTFSGTTKELTTSSESNLRFTNVTGTNREL